MTTRLVSERFPADFSVDGRRFGDGELRWEWQRSIGGTFTADAGELERLLPSTRLHPLRLSPRRAMLVAGGNICEWHVGSLPPFRSVDIAVHAMVTAGSRRAPPLLPMVGLSEGRGRASFGAGFTALLVITTNRVTREIYRKVLGWPAVLADARVEELPGHARVTATDAGQLLLDVLVRNDCSSKDFAEGQPFYGTRDGALFHAVTAGQGSGGGVNGPRAARLVVGDHPAVAPLRALRLSRGSWSANVCGQFEQTLTGPVAAVGPSRPSPMGSQSEEGPVRSAVAVDALGAESVIDQGLDALPFDPGGEFAVEAMPGLAEGAAEAAAADEPGANQGAKPSGTVGRILVGAGTAMQLALPTYSPHFAKLLDLQPDDVYLDVACGSGVFLRRRAHHVKRVAGIDHSTVEIDMARRVLGDRIADGTAEIVRGDAVVLPWPDATFTAVSCNCLDCFAPGKPAQTVTEMHRVLRPGGRVVIGLEGQMADPETAAQGMRPMLRPPVRLLGKVFRSSRQTDPASARRYEQRTGMSMFTDAELMQLLTDAGFTDIEMPPGTLSVFATAKRE